MIYYATLSPILVFNIFDTVRVIMWHNIPIRQLTMRFWPRAKTQII